MKADLVYEDLLQLSRELVSSKITAHLKDDVYSVVYSTKFKDQEGVARDAGFVFYEGTDRIECEAAHKTLSSILMSLTQEATLKTISYFKEKHAKSKPRVLGPNGKPFSGKSLLQ